MEEREALKRQIDLLQNLINNHKSVHGNTPFARAEQWDPARQTSARGRGQDASVVHPHSSRYAPQQHGNWRKTYSLNNKIPQSSLGQLSASTSSSDPVSSSISATGISHSTSLPGHSRTDRAATLSSVPHPGEKEGRTSTASTDTRKTHKRAPESCHEVGKRGKALTGPSVQQDPHRETQGFQQTIEGRHRVLPGKTNRGSSEVPSSVKTNTTTKVQSNSKLEISSHLSGQNSTEAANPANSTGGNVTKESQHISLNPSSQSSPAQVSAAHLKQSKFTWVKSQDVGGAGPRQAKSITQAAGKSTSVAKTSLSNAGVSSGSPTSSTISKRTPGKKLPRRLSLGPGAPKTSKYTWVSSSAGGQARLSQKPLSPKALAPAQRALEKGEATKKLRSASAHATKMRKATAASSSSSSPSSRYRWKAGGQSGSGAAAGGATVFRRGSAFHWSSEKNYKGVKEGLAASPSLSHRASVQPSSSPGGFKLRSRMKIIRRSASSGFVSERGTSPPSLMGHSKHSLRGPMHTFPRSPTGLRKTPSREFVSFGRHKLRRLSPTSFRTGPASPSHRSPASQRVFRTRYKMVTRQGAGAAHMPQYGPTLSWRAKRIQSARSLLQNRLRVPQDRHLPSQHWRGRGMRWIGGSLYRVSANKLSRTVAASTSINRTGRWFSPHHVSPSTSPLSRPSPTRHVASRAVQRSLAIIRHARQKKQPRQYCMYYNRFGKCNRGSSCPYIHDPDKVAVCTRFLRGTCKLADGTCPFSHKVAKEKMPVCSFFLKGICNNSSCPYSHVYVSRKADVCQDFIKGYCPQGEKCKKKHTLVCPEFSRTGSCPQGARCKLQHRQRAKRSTPNTSSTPFPAKRGRSTTSSPLSPAKRGHTKDSTKRPHLSVIMPAEQAQGTQADPGAATSGPLKLPSFISLSSSSEEAEAPDTPDQPSQVKEKLQIKPRL